MTEEAAVPTKRVRVVVNDEYPQGAVFMPDGRQAHEHGIYISDIEIRVVAGELPRAYIAVYNPELDIVGDAKVIPVRD